MQIPKILIISIPKCGTNLLWQILLGIPNTKKGTNVCFSNWMPGYMSFINQMVPGDVVTSHLGYSSQMAEVLNEKEIRRVFIYRDPRDVIYSMVHFITNVSKDRARYVHLHRYFKDYLLNDHDRMMTIIRGFKEIDPHIATKYLNGQQSYPNINEFFRAFMGWINDPYTLSVRFDNLVKDESSRRSTLLNIVDYLWTDIKHLSLEKNTIVDLMVNNINPATSPTFREGKQGTWGKYFSESHKKAFKEIAGDLLIELNYEKDLNW